MTNFELSTLSVAAFNAMSDAEQHEVLNFFNSDECTVELDETYPELFEAIMTVDFNDFEREYAKQHPDHKPPKVVICSDFE